MIIRAPFEDFEKSIRLGYIRTEIQRLNDFADPGDILSMDTLVDEINQNSPIELFKYVETGSYPKYRIEMPESLYNFMTENFFKPDALFKEEVIYLSLIFKEQLLTGFSNVKKITIEGFWRKGYNSMPKKLQSQQ